MRSPVTAEKKVEGERSVLENIPQRRDSVREQGQSLNVAPHDTDTQMSREDYCPGSACVFGLLLQIHGHTFCVEKLTHVLLLYSLYTRVRAQQTDRSVSHLLFIYTYSDTVWQKGEKQCSKKHAILSHTFSASRHSHTLTTHTNGTAQLSQTIDVCVVKTNFLSILTQLLTPPNTNIHIHYLSYLFFPKKSLILPLTDFHVLV